jgi:hypothetical protein
MKIHIARGGNVLGEFEESTVRERLRKKLFLPSDAAWKSDLPDWVLLGDLFAPSKAHRARALLIQSIITAALLVTALLILRRCDWASWALCLAAFPGITALYIWFGTGRVPEKAAAGIGMLMICWAAWAFFAHLIQKGEDDALVGDPRPASSNAYYAAEFAVKNSLKAPASADFSNPNIDAAGAVIDGGGKAHAWGWVDAENSFGAKLRSNWKVELEGYGNSWTATRVQIGGQDATAR